MVGLVLAGPLTPAAVKISRHVRELQRVGANTRHGVAAGATPPDASAPDALEPAGAG